MTTEDKRHVLTDMCHGFKKCGECNIGRDGRVDEPVLLDVIFKFAEEGEA